MAHLTIEFSTDAGCAVEIRRAEGRLTLYDRFITGLAPANQREGFYAYVEQAAGERVMPRRRAR